MEIKLYLNKINYVERRDSFNLVYLNKYEVQEYFNFNFIECVDKGITCNILNEHNFIYEYNYLITQHKSYDYYNSEYVTFKDKIDFLWK
jgi:hypothetical protein